MKKPCRKLIRIAFAVLFILPVFFSCSGSARSDSFNSTLDQIDALINQNQYKDAARELKKAEKKAVGSWAEIGIFRRYVRIEQKADAERVLLQSLKKNPENPELNAVYVNFLTREKRIEEAVSAGKILQGTKYGSIYSEAVMKNTLEKSASENLKQIFRSSEYFPVYYDAYTGSKDTCWLRNCALLRLAAGAYEGAASIHPAEVFGAEDAYFWTLVMYDAKAFGSSVNYGQTALKLLYSVSGKAKNLVSATKVNSILQDAWTSLGDADAAEKVRADYLASIEEGKGNWIISGDDESDVLYPVIFTNSAKWANDNDDGERCVSLLTFCVNNWKDYVPGLVAYSAFAWNSNQQRDENFIQLELRDEGLATLEMEKYDSRAKIPVSDAIYRINESLSRYRDPLLYIVKLDLENKMNRISTEKEKLAAMWKVLEDNAEAPGVYPELIMEYALGYFLENKMQEDSLGIFRKYICGKYKLENGNNFWEDTVKNVQDFSGREAEFAAYFAAYLGRKDDGLRLNEYCVFENDDTAEKNNSLISAGVSDETCLNLAEIYHSLGRDGEAVDLYGKLNGRSSDSMKKSAAMYRLALIYEKKGDVKNCRRCAEYALALNRRNTDAKMLVTRIKNGQVK